MVAVPAGSRRIRSVSSGCTETTTSAVSSASSSTTAPAVDVLLVGDQRVPSGAGLDGDVVAEPGQLADQLGHHRDAGLAVAGLPGHCDPHGVRT